MAGDPVFFALLTAFALEEYEAPFSRWVWLVPFIPLVISSGGNSGSQSATLIITALSRGHITLRDWLRVILRELAMGVLLGAGLATLGFFEPWRSSPATKNSASTRRWLSRLRCCW